MDCKKHPEKQPGKRSGQAFFIGLIISLALTLLAFEWKTYGLRIPEPASDDFVSLEEEELPIVILETKKPKTLPPPKVKRTLPKVMLEPDPEIKFVKTTPSVDEPDPFIDEFPPEPTEPEIEITQFPSVQPEFMGGLEAMYKYLADNIVYPPRAKEMGIEGPVYLQFIINTDGTISDVKLLRAQNDWLVNEAIRVVEKMPKWKPGKQGTRKVRVIYTLPIHFALK